MFEDEYYSYGKFRIKKYEIVEKDGEQIIVPTRQWKKIQKDNAFLSKLKNSSLPDSCVKYSFDSYIGKDTNGNIPKLRDFVQRFDTKYKSANLYLWSKENGTQKSTIASVIGKELLEKNYSVEFVLMSNLVKTLQQVSFEEDATSQVQKYLDCDLLIIDDSFDKGKMTVYKSGYQLPFLDTFLRQRIEQSNKATIITSNIPVESILKDFNPSIHSLISRSFYPMEFCDSYLEKDNFNIKDLWRD